MNSQDQNKTIVQQKVCSKKILKRLLRIFKQEMSLNQLISSYLLSQKHMRQGNQSKFQGV